MPLLITLRTGSATESHMIIAGTMLTHGYLWLVESQHLVKLQLISIIVECLI